MRKRVFPFTWITFSVKPTKWKRKDEYRYIFKNNTRIRQHSSNDTMISSHALSAFLLHHPLNGLGNANIRSVQEAMRASNPATEKYKNVCEDFSNVGILTKSSTPGEVQLTFGHSSVGNKSLGEYLQTFALAGDLGSPSVISFNLEIAFAPKGEKPAYRSRRSFFASPPATSHAPKSNGTGSPSTPSSSCPS